jgi:hypothetical protein
MKTATKKSGFWKVNKKLALDRAKKLGFDLRYFAKCWHFYRKRDWKLKGGKEIWDIFGLYRRFWQHKEPRKKENETPITNLYHKPTKKEYENALEKIAELENYFVDWAEKELKQTGGAYRTSIVNSAQAKFKKSAKPYFEIVNSFENGN